MKNLINVSVVMAVKNESKYILSAVKSILEQKGLTFELILVDDNSTDETCELVYREFSSYKNFYVYKNPKKGKVSAFNYGVSKSKGNFICLFAGDDIMPKNSLLDRFRLISGLPKEKPIAGLYKILTISENKKFNGKLFPKRKGQGSLSGQSPLMNRSAIDLLFPVPDSLPNEDTWLEVAFRHTNLVDLYHSDVICCYWRMHEGNSQNMAMPYAIYKKKMVLRRQAYRLFLEKNKSILEHKEIINLENMVEGIEHYANENISGLLLIKADLMWKIRIISTINPFFYSIRRNFYGLLSGW